GAMVVDPNNPSVVYIGGSRRFGKGGVLDHGLIRVDTKNIQDTTFNGGTVNDGDDIDAAAAAAANGGKFPDGVTYQKVGAFWTDLEMNTNKRSGNNSFVASGIHALALDAHGRLLIGSEGGIWRGVGYGFSYAFGFGAPKGPGITITTLNANL